MELNHLSDDELIKWIIKHDSDPVRVRIATIMERRSDRLMDDLKEAGMDEDTLRFEDTYDPGEYIRHLENELDHANDDLSDLRKKLREREAISLAKLISELNEQIGIWEHKAHHAEHLRKLAVEETAKTKEKMKVWRALTEDVQ